MRQKQEKRSLPSLLRVYCPGKEACTTISIHRYIPPTHTYTNTYICMYVINRHQTNAYSIAQRVGRQHRHRLPFFGWAFCCTYSKLGFAKMLQEAPCMVESVEETWGILLTFITCLLTSLCQSGRQLGGLNFDYYDPSESWANLRGCVEDKECCALDWFHCCCGLNFSLT